MNKGLYIICNFEPSSSPLKRSSAYTKTPYKFEKNFNPLSANTTKWSNTLKQFVDKLLTNCLSMFNHFAGLALKGLTSPLNDSNTGVIKLEAGRSSSILPILKLQKWLQIFAWQVTSCRSSAEFQKWFPGATFCLPFATFANFGARTIWVWQRIIECRYFLKL